MQPRTISLINKDGEKQKLSLVCVVNYMVLVMSDGEGEIQL